MRLINSIILHCSATVAGQNFHASDIDRWHRMRGFDGIGYHYVVDLDGTIEKGRERSRIGAHCKGQNAHSLGICYIGGLDCNRNPSDTRTDAQRESLMVLVRKLMTMYNLSPEQVHCHYEFAHKACPCFTIEEFRKEIKAPPEESIPTPQDPSLSLASAVGGM